MTRWLIHCVAAAMLVAAAAVADQGSQPARTSREPAVEYWGGALIMNGIKVDFLARFERDDSTKPPSYSGTIDIPIQGLAGGKLSKISVSDSEIRFSFTSPGSPGEAVFVAKPMPDDPAVYAGEVTQFGESFPLRIRRATEEEAAGFGPPRPQTPRPPFPYEERQVEYVNPADGARLAGTLTVPPGDGPFPVVMLITGSGPQDRDETIMGHKPFAVLAHHLTSAGVAVLRSDDRGTGKSTGSMEVSSDVLAADVLAGIEMLKTQDKIDEERIGLIGHSEGGIIAPMVAAESPDVDFIVLLAAPAFPGRDIMIRQLADISRASGLKEEFIAKQTEAQAALFDLMEANAPEDEMRAAVRKLVILQSGFNPPAEVNLDREPPPLPPGIQHAIDTTVEQMMSPWFRNFAVQDPRATLARVRQPVLAINGELDLQVAAKANLEAIEKTLKDAGNHDVITLSMPGLNHLLQPARTGLMDEYYRIEITLDPRVIAEITRYVRQRAGLEP